MQLVLVYMLAHTLLSCFGTTLLPVSRLDSPGARARASEPAKRKKIFSSDTQLRDLKNIVSDF